MNTCVPGTKPINGMYPACKFALTALTECLRQEISYIEMGIKVTVKSLLVFLNIECKEKLGHIDLFVHNFLKNL